MINSITRAIVCGLLLARIVAPYADRCSGR